MRTIKQVTSNIKSDGTEWSHDLSKNNLLIGPNESGKSSIVEAIQLALEGSVTNLLLRDLVKKDDDLNALIPIGSDTAFAQVEFSDGSTAEWKGERGKRSTRQAARRGAVAFPLSEIKKVLQGSEEKATKFFFERFAQVMEIETFKAHIPAETIMPEGEFTELLPDLGNGEPLTKISAVEYLGMGDTAGKISRDSRSKAKLLGNITAQFSVVAPEFDNTLDLWEELASSIRFEQLRKVYRNHEGLREFCSEALQELGTPGELKELRGSAIIHDEITERIMGRAMYDHVKRIREESITAATRSKNMAAVASAMMAAIRSLVIEMMGSYVKRVNTYLPKKDKLSIEISPGQFTYGLNRDGGLHRAMSGSTEARVLAAMAAALTRPKEATLVIVDDRMWDSGTLSRTMSALEKSPAQVIIMTTMKPRGRKRSGWDYIEMGQDAEVDAEDTVPSTAVEGQQPTL